MASTQNTTVPAPKNIAFFGASSGCGLAALKRAVADGHTCTVLLRNPSKLDAVFPDPKPANLILRPGNAHDVAAIASVLTVPSDPSRLVDAAYFTIGGLLNMKTMKLDDPDVCKKGFEALLAALELLRSERGAAGRPLLVLGSTTGISDKRDIPVAMMPMYQVMLKEPHADKRVMEARAAACGERWVAVRPSLLVDGEKPGRKIRVGVEDPAKGWERMERGYGISREDTGRWVYEELLRGANGGNYEQKAVTLTW